MFELINTSSQFTEIGIENVDSSNGFYRVMNQNKGIFERTITVR